MHGDGPSEPTRMLPAGISRRAILKGFTACAAGTLLTTGPRSVALAAGAWPVPTEEDGMETVRTDDGVNLAYRTQGEGPRNLLFMHGWAGSGAFFDETIKHLDLTGLRVIAYDLRGHGASDKPEDGYTLDRF